MEDLNVCSLEDDEYGELFLTQMSSAGGNEGKIGKNDGNSVISSRHASL